MIDTESISAFRIYLSQINQLLVANFSLASLYMTLPIPDICGGIEYPKDNHKERYIKWMLSNFRHAGGRLTDRAWAQEVWLLRGAFLHNFGASNQNTFKRRQIITFSEFETPQMHDFTIRVEEAGEVGMLSAEGLSQQILDGAIEWHQKISKNIDQILRLNEALCIYPEWNKTFRCWYPRRWIWISFQKEIGQKSQAIPLISQSPYRTGSGPPRPCNSLGNAATVSAATRRRSSASINARWAAGGKSSKRGRVGWSAAFFVSSVISANPKAHLSSSRNLI